MEEKRQEARFIPNEMPMRDLHATPDVLLQTALESFVQSNPPKSKFDAMDLYGLFGGITGIAYMLLQVSALHPDLKVKGDGLRQWADKYLGPNRDDLEHEAPCGLFSEKICYDAVRACVSGKEEDVSKFLEHFPTFLEDLPDGEEDGIPSELLYGRAGLLYLLRAVRLWVPSCKKILDEQLQKVARKIMQANDSGRKRWLWAGKQFAGAAHGDIGIVTQLVLSVPALARDLEPQVQKFLRMQAPNGNWQKHTDEPEDVPNVVQFCHGSPGFIYSFKALRPYYPNLQNEFDAVIARAQENVWKEGLLRKEPALCHGIPGNAL